LGIEDTTGEAVWPRFSCEFCLLRRPSGTISTSSGTASCNLCSYAGDPGTCPWLGLSSANSTPVCGIGDAGVGGRDIFLPSEASEKCSSPSEESVSSVRLMHFGGSFHRPRSRAPGSSMLSFGGSRLALEAPRIWDIAKALTGFSPISSCVCSCRGRVQSRVSKRG
jgi:hypothetical protein